MSGTNLRYVPFSSGGGGGGGSGKTIPSSTVTGNYTLQLTDAGTVVQVNDASPATVTIPPASSVAWVLGTVIELYAEGAGAVTIAAGIGVALDAPYGQVQLAAQYASACLRYLGGDVWTLEGNLA